LLTQPERPEPETPGESQMQMTGATQGSEQEPLADRKRARADASSSQESMGDGGRPSEAAVEAWWRLVQFGGGWLHACTAGAAGAAAAERWEQVSAWAELLSLLRWPFDPTSRAAAVIWIVRVLREATAAARQPGQLAMHARLVSTMEHLRPPRGAGDMLLGCLLLGIARRSPSASSAAEAVGALCALDQASCVSDAALTAVAAFWAGGDSSADEPLPAGVLLRAATSLKRRAELLQGSRSGSPSNSAVSQRRRRDTEELRWRISLVGSRLVAGSGGGGGGGPSEEEGSALTLLFHAAGL